MRLLFGLSIIATLAGWPDHAGAQRVDAGEFQRFLASDVYQTLVTRAVHRVPPAILHDCPGRRRAQGTVSVLKPMTFGPDGILNGGAWKQTLPVSGCGRDTILNFYFAVYGRGRINTVIGAPGTTHADPVLQQGAWKYAAMGAGGLAKDCKRFDIENTTFEGYGFAKPPTPDPGPEQKFRRWWETWTLTGCDRTFDVPVDFSPDPGGTQILVPMNGVVER